MDNLQCRALLGDCEAQKECTQKWIVLPCPHCGGVAEIFSTKMEAPCEHTEYQVMCKTCFANTWWNKFKYDALKEWNTRPSPPIGRCKDCACYPLARKEIGGYVYCPQSEMQIENEDSFCSSFEPREG